MKSMMSAGLEFGKQISEKNPELAQMMGMDGIQVRVNRNF